MSSSFHASCEATLPIDIPLSPLPSVVSTSEVIDLCSSSPAGQGPSTPLSLSDLGPFSGAPRAPKRCGQHRVVGPVSKRRLFADEDLGSADSGSSDSEADAFEAVTSDEDFVVDDSEASASDRSVSSDDETCDEHFVIDAAQSRRVADRLSFRSDLVSFSERIYRDCESRPVFSEPRTVSSMSDLLKAYSSNGACGHDFDRVCDSCLFQLAGVVDAALFLRCKRFSLLPSH